MQWSAGTPESGGVSSRAVLDFVAALEKFEFVHSFILIRNDIEIASGWWAPYRAETPHLLYSLSKSFISCAVGIAAGEGRLTLDTPLPDIFPEYRPGISDGRFFRMTVRHLLTMTTGHAVCSTAFFKAVPGGDFKRDFFTSPLEFEPGSRFVYNSGATFMLSAAIRRLTGENPSVYLKNRLLSPLGIGERRWEKSPDGTEFGGWGYRLTTREIASFARMLLHGGRAGGRQLVPAEYLAEATAFQVDNSMNEAPDWKQGYGFQFWRCRHNAFRGDGAFGQYALVIPEKNTALAVTAGGKNMQTILDIVWEHLLPRLEDRPLPEDPQAHARLREKLASLRLPQLHGEAPRRDTVLAAAFGPNETGIRHVRIEETASGCQVSFTQEDGRIEILRAGWQEPFEGETALEDGEKRPYSATARTTENGVLMRVYFTSTPFVSDYRFTVEGKKLVLARERNLHFRTSPWPELAGRVEENSGMLPK
ncbi:MAG: serine hydrolase [Lentisphaeria bacterium]|nr:serine hydrolase [Lentisphaeria bacterium]